MDIATITDITELKAMAYDQLMMQQQVEANLRLIQQRIEQLSNEQASQPVQQHLKKSNA